MRYVTISELSEMIRNNLWKIPHDIDLVVGIPRSGLMVANMVALYLNKRLSDIDSFVSGYIYGYGDRRAKLMNNTTIKKVLIVDDTVQNGDTITSAKEKISPLGDKYQFVFFAPITSSKGINHLDCTCEIIDDVRLFEWNLFHRTYVSESCFDLDGVLCPDPPTDDDGPIYTDYIKNAPLLFAPSCTIDTIISCRLEKYRKITEQWLLSNNIKYNNLVLLDLPDRRSRIEWGKYGEYKGEYYKQRASSWLFFESSPKQAETIASISNKHVICTSTNQLICPKQMSTNKSKLWIKERFPNLSYIYRKIISHF